MNTFKNPLDPDNIKTKMLLKQWVAIKLKLNPDTVVEITENQCSDATCLHAETIFHIFDAYTEGGDTISDAKAKLYKIAKPLVFIRKWDMEHIQSISNSSYTRHKH